VVVVEVGVVAKKNLYATKPRTPNKSTPPKINGKKRSGDFLVSANAGFLTPLGGGAAPPAEVGGIPYPGGKFDLFGPI
jgi:hypothetical protein